MATKKDKASKAKDKAKGVPPLKPEFRIESRALFEFLVGKAGGRFEAAKIFVSERFQGLPRSMTLKEALEMADQEGWGEILLGKTLGEIRGNAPVKAGAQRRARTSVKAAQQEVLGTLTLVPLAAREVAEILDTDRRYVSRILRGLVKEGMVERIGSRRDSRYRLPSQ